jgi:hypothetical protein
MTGTTITRDYLSALCLSFLKPPTYSGGSWTLNPDALADAILAALTWAPVEPVDTHRHYYVDISTFAAADAGRHNWLCECGATEETRDRA